MIVFSPKEDLISSQIFNSKEERKMFIFTNIEFGSEKKNKLLLSLLSSPLRTNSVDK